ncbi:hypothetical protein [Ideonella sp.]|uniref:hypothetical protein n=1 Tax=Ideonella sp. TaxID=1929293 RepID=UPI003BB7F7B4
MNLRPEPSSRWPGVAGLLLAAVLAGCGGGNPIGNPPDVENPVGTGGQKLSFAYFQKCIQPLLVRNITAPDGSTNTCASGGCHSSVSGTGGALRIVDSAPLVDLGLTAEAIRATDMYKNYYSGRGVSIPGDALQSRFLTKPLVRGVLHGGGQILGSDTDPVALLIRYWIDHPLPEGQDEFSAAAYSMFTPADPTTGSCNTP